MKAPTPSKLVLTLRALFAMQSVEVKRRIKEGNLDTPNLTHWITPAVEMIVPLLQEIYAHGMRKTAVELGIVALREGTLTDAHEEENQRYLVPIIPAKSIDTPPIYGVVHSLKIGNYQVVKAVKRAADAVLHRNRTTSGFNPKTIDAVNQAALYLCRETIDTLTTDLDETLEEIRAVLRRGLRYETRTKDVYATLARRVEKLFTDRYRAVRIANTEFKRAVHAGAVLEAKEAPFRTVKVWQAPADACKICRKLHNVRRELDKPFATVEGAGPYNVTNHPPLHPNCDCKMEIQKAR